MKKLYFSGVIYSGMKICVFGTQLLNFSNTTVTSLEQNLQKLSNLGVQIGTATISAIGQADDSALLSNNIHSLSNLLLPTI